MRITPREADWLVLTAAVVMAVPSLARGDVGGPGWLVLPFATVPLLWRRSHPGTVLAVLATALLAAILIGREAPGNVGVLFGLYAAGRYGGARTRMLTCGLVGTSVLVGALHLIASGNGRISPHLGAAGIFAGAAAWILGEAVRTRQAYRAELEDRLARQERDRETQAQLAAEAERMRIARELHDLVSHQVSVIAVQAGAAGATSRDRPERALEALAVIERTARRTLGELRALLGVLRADEEETPQAPLRPGPSIAQLGAFAAHAEAAGVRVTLSERGTPVRLDPAVELGAFRVVQEALTNVIKHAPGASAEAEIEYRPDALHIKVSDDGPGTTGTMSHGHGLIGMRERVTLAGGELEVGPLADRGFRVFARFPLAADRAAR